MRRFQNAGWFGGLHGRHHGFGGGGPRGFFSRLEKMSAEGFRGGRLLSSDDLQLLILFLLDEKPRHGYEIIKALTEKSAGLYTPSPGMIYPALTYLEETGFAASENDGTKKLVSITEEGRTQLAGQREEAERMLERLAAFGQRVAQFRDQMSDEENAAEKWAGSPRDRMKREWREMKDEFQDLRRELKMALFEKLNSSTEEKKRILEIMRKAIAEIRGKSAHTRRVS